MRRHGIAKRRRADPMAITTNAPMRVPTPLRRIVSWSLLASNPDAAGAGNSPDGKAFEVGIVLQAIGNIVLCRPTFQDVKASRSGSR